MTLDRGAMSSVFIDSNNGSRTHSGVVTNNIRGVGHALLGLTTLGGDDLLTVLYCGDVSVDSTHCASNTPTIHIMMSWLSRV